MLEPPPVLIIGGGVMGRAIAEGLRRTWPMSPCHLMVAEPDAERRAAFDAARIAALESAEAALAFMSGGVGLRRTLLVLAVKPQIFPELAREVAPALASGMPGGGGPLVVSIMAGVPAARVREALGGRVRVVRAMPNTPGRIGEGVTGIARGPDATDDDMAVAIRLFGALGPLVVPIDESLMDAFTAVAGSGPAYLFYLAEAMERAARDVGFGGAEARAVVAQTLRGAAALLDGADPASLRAAVTSKGGTTAAATGSMDRDGVAEAIVRAIVAARDRGRELAG